MSIDFDELPFKQRADLTPYLIHLTRRDKNASALDNLVSILRTGKIWGSGSEGYVMGKRKAACLMDVPFASLKHVCRTSNKKYYEPYGIILTKATAYKKGTRPVLYLSAAERKQLSVPPKELWRVVTLEVHEKTGRWVSWLHEREWRCPDELSLPPTIHAALVKTSKEAQRLHEILSESGAPFACRPNSIIPLGVVCQGLAD